MSLRKLYALAGAAWGLVLGAVAGVGTVGYALGFSWLFLFGDSTWPAAAGPVIIGFGIVVFLFFFVSLTAFGYVYGQRLEHAMPGSDPGATGRHRRRAFLLMASAGVAALLLVGAGAARELADTRAREARAAEEASFDDLVGRRYSIGPIEVILTGAADTLVARFEAAGDRDGEYQLRWRVNEPTYDSLLVTGDATFLFSGDPRTLVLRFALVDLRDRYRDRVLAGRGGVLVEQAFHLTVFLQPLLTPEEEAVLPERELHNLSLGYSPLLVEATADLPVRFTIR